MKLSKDYIERSTNYAVRHKEKLVKQLNKYEQDTDEAARKSLLLCKRCFYLRVEVALQAFTAYQCQNCNGHFQHHNSNVPKYCENCASSHNCCTKCAATL